MTDVVELEAREVAFFSECDEHAFFAWVAKIPCVDECVGRGFSIFLMVDSQKITEGEFRELLSLFKRYGVEMKQLSVFDDDRFSSWFRQRDAFWYSEIFN